MYILAFVAGGTKETRGIRVVIQSVYAWSHFRWIWDSAKYYFVSTPLYSFMDMVSRLSQGYRGVQYGGFEVTSLLFADDDDVLFTPCEMDFQHALEGFATLYQVAGIRTHTYYGSVLGQSWMLPVGERGDPGGGV